MFGGLIMCLYLGSSVAKLLRRLVLGYEEKKPASLCSMDQKDLLGH